jgi:hypothetical protein
MLRSIDLVQYSLCQHVLGNFVMLLTCNGVHCFKDEFQLTHVTYLRRIDIAYSGIVGDTLHACTKIAKRRWSSKDRRSGILTRFWAIQYERSVEWC